MVIGYWLRAVFRECFLFDIIKTERQAIDALMSHYPISPERQCKGTAFWRYMQLFAIGKVNGFTFGQVIAYVLREIHHFHDIEPLPML